MALMTLTMTYEKQLEIDLQNHIADHHSHINQTARRLNAQILSFYQTLCGNHLIFLIDTPLESYQAIEQTLIESAPTRFKETKILD
ncbi:hypothetical protein N9C31_02165 [Gammaproteobacteria bacterium]|nr:hypothetical protein [Gammaproteobacteria bacterium]